LIPCLLREREQLALEVNNFINKNVKINTVDRFCDTLIDLEKLSYDKFTRKIREEYAINRTTHFYEPKESIAENAKLNLIPFKRANIKTEEKIIKKEKEIDKNIPDFDTIHWEITRENVKVFRAKRITDTR
jgi:hypothetical protein